MKLTAQDIDKIIDAQYSGLHGSGELQQLAHLFSNDFWLDFEELLRDKLNAAKGPYSREVSVGLGYIDKIPVARFDPSVNDIHGNLITEGTELADAAVIFIDKVLMPNGKHRQHASALLLQAKQAEDADLPKQVPIVSLPTSPNASTLKELALLTDWPKFDLYFGGNSGQALQRGYVINNGSGSVQPQAWFIGAPPSMSTPWSSAGTHHWIAGPSANATNCTYSLGQLLEAMLTANGTLTGTKGVGQNFNFDLGRLVPHPRHADQIASSSTPPTWDDLCHQILLACNRYKLPRSLFSGRPSRGVGTKVHAFGRTVHSLLVKNQSPLSLTRAWISDKLAVLLRKHRFYVLVIVQVAGEE